MKRAILGMPCSLLRGIWVDGANLSDTIYRTILNLETQIRELNGSLEICRKIKKENVEFETFDENYYWRKIIQSETSGKHFLDVSKDFRGIFAPILFIMLLTIFEIPAFFLREKLSPSKKWFRKIGYVVAAIGLIIYIVSFLEMSGGICCCGPRRIFLSYIIWLLVLHF